LIFSKHVEETFSVEKKISLIECVASNTKFFVMPSKSKQHQLDPKGQNLGNRYK